MRINLWLLLGVIYCFASCSSGSNNGGEVDEGTYPALHTSSPLDGAENVASGNLTITLTFDQLISFASSDYQKITLGNATVLSAEASNKELIIKAEGLLEGSEYRLIVPKGIVKGSGIYSNKEEISISFDTKPGAVAELLLPCDEHATEETKKLYTYLRSVYGEKCLSGTMANVDWNSIEAENVYELTGKYPAMNTFDFISICYDWSNYSDIAPVREWSDAGGIVSLMWHFHVPVAEGASDYDFYSDKTAFKCSNVFVDGTWENDFFYDQMDEVCEVLLKMQEAGIPAVWRPFHEAAGGWFWWGSDGGEAYVKLWKLMFDYFQNKGIHNLIWVWTTETGDEEYYPGDGYVDIVGRDLYGKGANDSFKEWKSIEEKYAHKMVALSECGNSVSNGSIANSQSTIGEQWSSKGCRWLYFMPWYDYDYNTGKTNTNLICSNSFWTNAMSRSYVLTRDQIKIK